MERSYAEALWKVVARGTDAKSAVHSLAKLLSDEGRSALLPKIARALERIAAREAASGDRVVTVAKEADIARALKEVKHMLDEREGGKVSDRDLKTRVDETLIGGWRLEGQGELVDKSYKKQLLDIYNHAVNG